MDLLFSVKRLFPDCFFPRSKTMYCVFVVLSVNLLACNQIFKLINSRFIKRKASETISDSTITVVSSANKIYVKDSEMLDKSLIYSINSKGPSIDPWGTPHYIY